MSRLAPVNPTGAADTARGRTRVRQQWLREGEALGEQGAWLQPAGGESARSPVVRRGEDSLGNNRPTSGAGTAEHALVDALRRGDERVFADLVDRHGAAMFRLARTYERDPAVAEEIVQDAWLGLLRGIERFEGRSSLRTWLFRIVANVARSRAVREARSVPFSALTAAEVDNDVRSVAPERFRGPEHRWAGHWAAPPHAWSRPEQVLESSETRVLIAAAIDALPQSQRVVITLRDVEGWSAEDVCALLEISESNQRVILHRARSRVRQALDDYLTEP